MKILAALSLYTFIVISMMTLDGCDRDANEKVSASEPVSIEKRTETPIITEGNESEPVTQFNIGNTKYLFDIPNHSAEELEALLRRAEEIREAHAEGYEDLEIILVLHGPDINIFRQENYNKHKRIVDLAAKLDAFDIIDLKICETTMSSMGVDRSEVPAFIESVPYAPDEIRRLGEEGYMTL